MDITLIFPNNLFHVSPILNKSTKIFLFQDPIFFKDNKHPINFHKKKILLHLSSMESYNNKLISEGYDSKIIYFNELLEENYLNNFFIRERVTSLSLYRTQNNALTQRLSSSAYELSINIKWHESPLFLLNTDDIEKEFFNKSKFMMSNFYKNQRKRFNLLMTQDSKPIGGKWSYDAENRKKLPKNIHVPNINKFFYDEKIMEKSKSIINKYFSDNHGNIDNFNYPIDRNQALISLDEFLEERMHNFGIYEDAISEKDPYLFHGIITPYLNIGLVTPQEILNRVIEFSENNSVPLNSLEGFIRQVIGWREFIRGIYESSGSKQRTSNYWGFKRDIPDSFYNFSTGILPVDNVVKKVIDNAYAHHIERLMILGNFMFLLGIKPDSVYKWFMELFIDSYDWVMVPNIYGMSQFSDGGLMATKPYISGSNYILKMSNFKKGEWCDIWDSLYWNFIKRNENFFLNNPRLSLMISIYNKKNSSEIDKYNQLEKEFINKIF